MKHYEEEEASETSMFKPEMSKGSKKINDKK